MKKLFSAIFAFAATIAISTVSVSALTAGYSDYGTSDTKTVAAVQGDKISLTDTTRGAIVDIPKTALPAEVTAVTFASKLLDTSSATHKAASALATTGGFSDVAVFDLKLLDQNSSEVKSLNGKISVTLKVTGDANTVLYYDDAANKLENLGGTVANGFITFETSHFSYYLLAKTSDSAVTIATTTQATVTVANPATGDTRTTTAIIVAVMGMVALGTSIAAAKLKKSK